MKYEPKGVGEIILENIILDLNGTLAVKGKIVLGAKERLNKLKRLGFQIYLFSGDQRGNAASLAKELGIKFVKGKSSQEKEELTRKLDTKKTVAIGNARIDIGTFKPCKLRIGTLQPEGIHTGILKHIDILVPSINDALDLLLDPHSLNSTLKK
ncbi:MAG: HAD family hydrolase [Candidatus Shapirobacteria bacterium]